MKFSQRNCTKSRLFSLKSAKADESFFEKNGFIDHYFFDKIILLYVEEKLVGFFAWNVHKALREASFVSYNVKILNIEKACFLTKILSISV